MTTPVRIGPEFLVNTTTGGDQGVGGSGEADPAPGLSIAALSNGGFAVTRADHSGPGGGTSGSAVAIATLNVRTLSAGDILVLAA